MFCVKLGQKLIIAVEKSFPISIIGKSKLSVDCVFKANNPHLVEVLPDFLLTQEGFKTLSHLDGKKLSKVGKFLDSVGGNQETFSRAMEKYLKIFKSKTIGFNDKEISDLYKKAFPNIKVPSNVNEDAFMYLNLLSKESGSRFDAHGMAKVGVADQLKQLNNILSNGIDKTRPFHTAPLVAKNSQVGVGLGTAGGCAYRDGSFILVGAKGQKIVDGGVKYVIVNDAYYNIIDDLARKFPNVKFIKANSAAESFEKIAQI